MTMQIRQSEAVKPVLAFEVHHGGVQKPVKIAQIRIGGVFKTFWQAMTASLSRSSVDGFGDSTGAITITTQSVTASAIGGTAPFTYAWSSTGGDVPTINSPASSTTTFTFADVDPGSLKSGTLICAITDANGTVAATSAVTVTARNVSTA